MQHRLVAGLLLALLTSGCGGFVTPLPGTTELIDKLPAVQNSTKSPCWQQRQIAAQGSYVETIRQKQEVVFKAPCDVDKKKPEAKIS